MTLPNLHIHLLNLVFDDFTDALTAPGDDSEPATPSRAPATAAAVVQPTSAQPELPGWPAPSSTRARRPVSSSQEGVSDGSPRKRRRFEYVEDDDDNEEVVSASAVDQPKVLIAYTYISSLFETHSVSVDPVAHSLAAAISLGH